jgi:RND family efflux transporter MFP subunit
MRGLTWLTVGGLFLFMSAPQFLSLGPKAGSVSPAKAAGPAAYTGGPLTIGPATVDPATVDPATGGPLEVTGLTQCAPGRRGIIAPVPLHPVIEVKVQPGQRVKKGQELVTLDDDEPRADVRLKQALLDSAQHAAKEARRFLAKAESVTEIMPEQRLFDARLALRKAEADERAARASLDSAAAELEHYRIVAVLDGVVSWLDVYPGVVARPGTTVWGEIVDLRELDVRCELTPDEADRVAVGEKVEVRPAGGKSLAGASIVFIGPVADAKSGRVPVLVRLPNPDEHLRSGVPVSVRFTTQAVCKR